MSDQAAPPSSSENIQVEEDASLRVTSKSRASRLRPAQADGPQTSTADQRRHSTRSVKRRKFDDELVESSLKNKPEKQRTSSKTGSEVSFTGDGSVKSESVESPQAAPQTSTSVRTTRSAASSSTLPVGTLESQESVSADVSASKSIPVEKRKATTKNTVKTKGKKVRRSTPPAHVNATKNLGRWKPQDDLLLIEAVQQTSDLKSVHIGVKFSCSFKLRDLEDRWHALLYNEKVSKLAMSAIHQLPYDEILRVQSKALFSKQEEEILSTVTIASQPNQATFSNLLKTNIGKFHKARTSKSLHEHWTLMKQYHLLPDQSVQPLPKNDHILNFSDAEELLDDKRLSEPSNPFVQREMALSDRKQKKEMRQLEQELPKWQVLVESITGSSHPDFDSQTLAILRGRLVRYLMRSKEISIGRSAKDHQVDVDLALEGPAFKISRRQGSIKLRNNGEFLLTNNGKRPIYVDSRPVLQNGKHKLHNNSVIEITCLRFIFLINQDLIRSIKSEVQKSSSTVPP